MRCKALATAIVFFCCTSGYGQHTDTLSVYFDHDRSVLRQESRATLDQWVTGIRQDAGVTDIALSGYCDSTGSDRYNDSLSAERIAAVRGYLYSKGIADSLFGASHAYGRRQPFNDNRTETARRLNRRVVISWQTVGAVTTAKPGSLKEAFKDTMAIVGRNIVLDNLYFYGGRHVPLPVSLVQLNELLQILQDHPGLRIEIQGYVCCVPDEEDGVDDDTQTHDLSLRRARYVYTYLIGHGIEQDRLSFKGFGGRHKVSPEEFSEEQKAKNRRVEIKVLGW